MRQSIFIATGLLLSLVIIAQNSNPFLTLSYDSLVIYDYEYKARAPEEFSIISEDGKLASKINKSRKLNSDESSGLSKTLGLKSSYGQVKGICFSPHLGIVYYTAGKPIAHITVCMGCNVLVSSIDIPDQKQGKFTADNGQDCYSLDGMSKNFRKHLNKLLWRYDFPHKITGPINEY